MKVTVSCAKCGKSWETENVVVLERPMALCWVCLEALVTMNEIEKLVVKSDC